MRRTYSNQLKGECIEMYVGQGLTSPQVSKIIGVPAPLILKWVQYHWFGKVDVRYGHHRSLTIKHRICGER